MADYGMKGIDDKLKVKLNSFFKEFIIDEHERDIFITEKLQFKDANIPRIMINSIERLVSLSDDIEIIRKGRESLKVFFLVVCIETLYSLSFQYQKEKMGKNIKMKKMEIIIDFFHRFIRQNDKEIIINNIEAFFPTNSTTSGIVDIDITRFALLINEVRNLFVHEGNYWDFSFCSDETPLVNSLKTKIEKDGKAIDLGVVTSLRYSVFRKICVNGLIHFANDFFIFISNQDSDTTVHNEGWSYLIR
jgi:hypothetical protein